MAHSGSDRQQRRLYDIFSGEDGIYVSCGCFYGSISEFEKAVEKTHAGTKHERDYKLAIELAKSRIQI